MGFLGKPSTQGYPQISGCFDPLELPSEETKATVVRDASMWRIEQHCHTLIHIGRNPPIPESAFKCYEIGLKILEQKLSTV